MGRIIPFVYEGTEEIRKYMQCEVSRTFYMGRIANLRKIPKLLSLTNSQSESLNIDVHTQGTYGHTKYDVSDKVRF